MCSMLMRLRACKVRKALPKFSERVLTSTKILAQRSAVTAVFSRAAASSTSTSTKLEKRKAIPHDEKSRLLRMGKKLRRGPFDAYVDPDQVGEGSAMLELSEAAKKAGSYDIWSEAVPDGVAVKVRPVLLHPSRTLKVQLPNPVNATYSLIDGTSFRSHKHNTPVRSSPWRPCPRPMRGRPTTPL